MNDARIIRLDDYRARPRRDVVLQRKCPECRTRPADSGWCEPCTAEVLRKIAEHRQRKLESSVAVVGAHSICAGCLDPIDPRSRILIDWQLVEVFQGIPRLLKLE